MVIKFIVFLLEFQSSIWLLSGLYIHVTRRWFNKEPYQFARTIFHELKPFYLPGIILGYIIGSMYENRNGWDIVVLIVNVFYYWVYKDVDKDDRWKRRKEKLAEVVKQVGNRLEVVPSNA